MGYVATYDNVAQTANNVFVPVSVFEVGEKYIIVNSNGDYAMTANGSIGRSQAKQQTGSLDIGGVTYNKWFNAENISENCVLSAESGSNGVKLKTSSGQYLQSNSIGLVVQSSGGSYTINNGSIRASGQNRYISYSSNAFRQSSSGNRSAVIYKLVSAGVLQKVNITNTPIADTSFTLNIFKTDAKSKTTALSGAVFELRSNVPLHFTYNEKTGRYIYTTDTNAKTTLVSKNNGFIYVDGLPSGSYTLVETVAPFGYDTAPDCTIVLDENVKNHTYSVTVEDYKKSDLLPSTGSCGRIIIYISGTILVIASVIYGCFLKRKRKGGK